jgi:hypothetical protein
VISAHAALFGIQTAEFRCVSSLLFRFLNVSHKNKSFLSHTRFRELFIHFSFLGPRRTFLSVFHQLFIRLSISDIFLHCISLTIHGAGTDPRKNL